VIASLIQANTNVQPEKSTSHTVGFIWSPTNSVQASVDYWYIHRMNFIDRYSSQFTINNEFNRRSPGEWGATRTRDVDRRHPELGSDPQHDPALRQLRRPGHVGLRLRFRVPLCARRYGRLNIDSNWTYVDKNDWQFQKGVNYTGGAGNFFANESPRIKGQTTFLWDYRDFETLLRYNYTGHWKYGDNESGCYVSGANAAYLGGSCLINDWPTYDVGLTYKGIKNLSIGVLVRNVLNTAAPYGPDTTYTSLGFNPTLYNPYGRYYQFTITTSSNNPRKTIRDGPAARLARFFCACSNTRMNRDNLAAIDGALARNPRHIAASSPRPTIGSKPWMPRGGARVAWSV
jgi:iron complex outermembrane receptor protein